MTIDSSIANDKFIWDGLYKSWADALAASKTKHEDSLSGGRWLSRISQQRVNFIKEFDQYAMAMPPRPCNLPIVYGITQPTSIVDFGGSSGWSWEYLKRTVVNQLVKSYLVVETDEVVGYMKNFFSGDPAIKYCNFDDVSNKCDLLYCNSVLQYFESNEPFFSLIKRTRPKFILMDDLVAVSGNDFFTTQKYYEGRLAYRFIGLINFLEDLRIYGYREVVRFPYGSPVNGCIQPFQMSNFSKEKQLRYSWTIFFEKIN